MSQIITPTGFAKDPWAGTNVPPLAERRIYEWLSAYV